MINTEYITQQLEDIVTNELQGLVLPYKKGNSIRIKNTIIRKNKYGYQLFDNKNNCHITKTFTRTAAIAIAKRIAVNDKKAITDIKIHDKEVHRHYNDASFFKNTMINTVDEVRREVAECRFDISTAKAYHHLDLIEEWIFDK